MTTCKSALNHILSLLFNFCWSVSAFLPINDPVGLRVQLHTYLLTCECKVTGVWPFLIWCSKDYTQLPLFMWGPSWLPYLKNKKVHCSWSFINWARQGKGSISTVSLPDWEEVNYSATKTWSRGWDLNFPVRETNPSDSVWTHISSFQYLSYL